MKTTFRTFAWDHGAAVGVAACLALSVLWGCDLKLAGGVLALPTLCYVAYALCLVLRYPLREDLPEWREYEARNKDRRQTP